MQSESRMPQSSVMGYGLDWAMATEAQYSICLTLCHDLSLLTHHFVQTCMSLGHIPAGCGASCVDCRAKSDSTTIQVPSRQIQALRLDTEP
ncbi:hypothetical protein EMCRGX_G008476 [Ephydatia muelleri]